MKKASGVVIALALAGITVQPAFSANVKITPLGSHDGEFCALDRALIFEDPDGTRILYDAGRTVRGADDPRLGKIDAVLLSHVHGDHLGDIHQAAANAGDCGKRGLLARLCPVTTHGPRHVRRNRLTIRRLGAEGSHDGAGQGSRSTQNPPPDGTSTASGRRSNVAMRWMPSRSAIAIRTPSMRRG